MKNKKKGTVPGSGLFFIITSSGKYRKAVLIKKSILMIVIMVLSLLLLPGCMGEEPPDNQAKLQVSEITQLPQNTLSVPSETSSAFEEDAVQLICSMMSLDYPSMSVADFNQNIQQLCTDADTTIFDAISHTYDFYAVYNDAGEYMDTVITDPDVRQFLQTTLSYSSQEIFGEPVHMGSIMYMTMPGMTAFELDEKKEQMQPEEWDRYLEENMGEINVFPVLSYEIEANVQDTNAITVSQRDNRINQIHSAIKEYFLGLDKDQAAKETLEEDLLTEFQQLSSTYSDNSIEIICRIQALERDI